MAKQWTPPSDAGITENNKFVPPSDAVEVKKKGVYTINFRSKQYFIGTLIQNDNKAYGIFIFKR